MDVAGEDGYELWLRYRKVDNPAQLARYRKAIRSATVLGKGATADIIRRELGRALPVLLDSAVPLSEQSPDDNALVMGTVDELEAVGATLRQADYRNLGEEGFLIRSHQKAGSNWTLITGNSGLAVLAGTFHFLRLLQTHQDIHALDLFSCPRIRHRVLGHWDRLDGSIERGYAGRSLWNWDELPEITGTRYHDYARACASIGINGTVLNNVNAQAGSLSAEYLEKTAALADLFRPYGIRVYLSPLFSAPVQLGGLATNDPRDPAVAEWWKAKVDEIYRLMPDFGGFEVKANSEGQPGPQDYGANHDDGANMLAAALEPHGGMVLWRAFVYDTATDADRAKCAYKEFVPLDGKFRPNVLVQVKNGPVDFQPREPFHPLIGALERTPLALELQITQEYLGQAIHLVYLAGMWKEILDADTYARGPGSTVARIVDGSAAGHPISSIVGVANTGSDRNWCGHHFAQANWYAFGRLAWDSELSAEAIADEWVRATWSNDPLVVEAIKTMMLDSWEACINYMTPLGLHHIMQEGHHYGPDPGFNAAKRADWNNVYYHRADTEGVGFDRSSTGSNAASQYHSPLREQFNDMDTCPEELLLWFHHVPWDHGLRSGPTLWEELQQRYDAGVAFVQEMGSSWQSLQAKIDPRRHRHVSERLKQQLQDARLWRDVCIDYVYEATQRHPSRILGFGWADPHLGVERSKNDVKRCINDYGFYGVKLNGAQNSYYIDDPRLSLPLVEEIAKTGKLLAFHVGTDAYEATHPFRVAKVARMFPELRILMAHMGGVAHHDLSNAAIEMAQECPNLVLIGSAVRSRALLKAIKTLGAGRVCFGSDTPFELMHVEVAKYHALLDGEVSPEEKQQIMGGNIGRLMELQIA